MDILYISSYPTEYFKRLININGKSSSLPAQKFNSLLVQGLTNNNHKVTVLSAFNHLKWIENGRLIRLESIIEDHIEYIFLPMLKIGIIGRVYTHGKIKKFIKDWCVKHPNGVVFIDILKPYSHIVSKYCKDNSIVSIVTDLPEHILISNNLANKILNRFKLRNYNRLLMKSTHFVFLTEAMNKILNKNSIPYCIVEGLVDSKMALINTQNQINQRKVCLYSGALHKKYGVEALVNAFMLEDLKKYELHLYGSGDFEEELIEITKDYLNIKYFGVVENNIVVEKQMQATILINPRPSNEDFTKYSFPSKNLEYMVTGRPVITTFLPGMPNEYKDYVYIIEDESIKGIANKVKEVLEKDIEVLNLKGEIARSFVLNEKNNIIQAGRIIKMLKSEN